MNNTHIKLYIWGVLNINIMFVRIKKSGVNEYLQIVQNYRDGYKTKQRVIGTLGRINEVAGSKDIDTLISKLSKYSNETLMVITGQSKIDARSVSIGPGLIFERLWQEIGMPGIIHGMVGKRKFSFDIERAIFLTVLHRLFVSGSDRSCEKWKEDYHIERTGSIALHQLFSTPHFLDQRIAFLN